MSFAVTTPLMPEPPEVTLLTCTVRGQIAVAEFHMSGPALRGLSVLIRACNTCAEYLTYSGDGFNITYEIFQVLRLLAGTISQSS